MRGTGTSFREGMDKSSWSSEQRSAVLTEADRILADPSFKKSRRCVVLFRRLVEHALEGGDEDGIKERTLGIEVFGREANYDTNTDPIVRMAANEIRKRLAQYYHSTNRHHEVYIALEPGSYMPRFDFGLRSVPVEPEPESLVDIALLQDAAEEVHGPELVESESDRLPERKRFPKKTVGALLLVCTLALAGVGAVNWANWTAPLRSSQYLLWSPLLKTPGTVAVCIPDLLPIQFKDQDWAHILASMIAGNPPPNLQVDPNASPSTPFVDSEVSARMSALVNSYGKPFKITRSSEMTLEDFRHQPVVLIGAFDNFWTITLLSKLRYHIQIDPDSKEEWIEDEQNPAMHNWKGSGKLQYSESSVDYALITRMWDKDTGTWILAVGGLGMHATEAAGDLLTDPGYSRVLPDAIRSGKRNVQIVLKTTVISGHTGAPQIIAVYTWQ